MQKITDIFHYLQSVKIMVVGDFMLDTYVLGDIKRISPEAPVSIVKVIEQKHLPGGAGNVVLNLHALGAEVVAVGCIGQDLAGQQLHQGLAHKGIDQDLLWMQPNFSTIVKSRVIASSQQVMRIDFEQSQTLPVELEEKIIQAMLKKLSDVNVVAISDYQKGFLTDHVLRMLITACHAKNIPVIVDPKGSYFEKYRGATIIKPNLKEALAAASMSELNQLEEAADRLLEKTQAQFLVVTCSEKGIALFDQKRKRIDFSAKVREVKDVTGAGDTVLATLAFSLAHNMPLSQAIELANIAAGIAVERVGCAQVMLPELARRLLENDMESKIFDGRDYIALQHALQTHPFIIVCLPDTGNLTAHIFQKINQIKLQYAHCDLVLYLHDYSVEGNFALVVAALPQINWVVICGQELQILCANVRPEAIFSLDCTEGCIAIEHCTLETISAVK